MIETATYFRQSPSGRGQLDGVSSIMSISISGTLLGWWWFVAALLGLIIIVLGVAKHVTNITSVSNLDFLHEILSFTLAVPLAFGLVLTLLAHIILKPIEAEDTLTDKVQNRVKQRVLIVENQLLLGAALQDLLTGEAELDVVGISPRDQVELVREIRRIRPDVVLLDENSCLTKPAKLLAFLEDYPRLRLLLVNADDHLVRIYSKQEILVEHVPQLVNIICHS